MEEDVKAAYFDWMIDMIDGWEHIKLMIYLNSIPFTWEHPMDENRAEDGAYLREEFIYETNYSVFEYPPQTVSVLEVLVALARRINFICVDIEEDDQSDRWFWEMMRNIDLERYNDQVYELLGGNEEVWYRIDTVLKRTYESDGRFGLFPLKTAEKDQRDVELWYQMNAYLMENYFNNDRPW